MSIVSNGILYPCKSSARKNLYRGPPPRPENSFLLLRLPHEFAKATNPFLWVVLLLSKSSCIRSNFDMEAGCPTRRTPLARHPANTPTWRHGGGVAVGLWIYIFFFIHIYIKNINKYNFHNRPFFMEGQYDPDVAESRLPCYCPSVKNSLL